MMSDYSAHLHEEEGFDIEKQVRVPLTMFYIVMFILGTSCIAAASRPRDLRSPHQAYVFGSNNNM